MKIFLKLSPIVRYALLLAFTGLTTTCFAEQTADRTELAAQYISKGEAPYEYIADKLRNYKVVAIGEDHWIAEHSQFLCDVMRNVGYTDDTRIDNLALEFGSEKDQAVADSLAFGKSWNEEYANRILLNAPDDFGNPFKGYRDVLYTVWETNRLKPDSLKTRIVLLDPVRAPRNPEDRDGNMARLLRLMIWRREKTLFYAGQAHTQNETRGGRASENGYYYNYPSASKYIKMCYPRDIFVINLWGGFMGTHGYQPDKETVWTLIDGGVIDKAFEKNGNRPVGFDIDASFPLTPSQLYAGKNSGRKPWATDPVNGDPYTADLTMADYCDGIIFIKPVKEFTGMQLIDIYNDEWIAAHGDRSDPPAKTRDDIFRKVLEWHPTCLPLNDK